VASGTNPWNGEGAEEEEARLACFGDIFQQATSAVVEEAQRREG